MTGALREARGLLRLIVEAALGEPTDEYMSVPTIYLLEAKRLAFTDEAPR